MKPGNVMASVMFAIAVNAVLVSSAHAYIDPGTGTMMLQIAGALIASALFYLRSIRLWIAGKLGLGRGPEPAVQRTDREGSRADQPDGD